MSETSLTPGKSLESDLRLIREARGVSREDIFNRVHIRPEVLAQVEEHGFAATPSLNSDIHRRSFVKHYADAVGIDAEIALGALDKSASGRYDGSLAIEYLGLDPGQSLPRWASDDVPPDDAEPDPPDASSDTPSMTVVPVPPSTTATDDPEAPDEPVAADGDESTSADASFEALLRDLPEFDLPKADDPPPVFPAPEDPLHAASPSDAEVGDLIAGVGSDAEADAPIAPPAEGDTPVRILPLDLAESQEPVPATEPPDSPDLGGQDVPADDEPPEEEPVVPTVQASPYAPPMPGQPATTDTRPAEEVLEATASPTASGDAAREPRRTIHFETPQLPDDPDESQSEPQETRRRESSAIPSSTTRQSHIGPLEDEDYGELVEEMSFWERLRNQHWLTWIGLTGVVAVIIFFSVQSFTESDAPEDSRATNIASIAQLPTQFSGIVRLSPTTERFVTLQLTADSASETAFDYKIWTHSAGSTFAETGAGSLNLANNQILLGEPYGVGGLFVLENGRYRLRSVRRVRFPRWEFTGQAE